MAVKYQSPSNVMTIQRLLQLQGTYKGDITGKWSRELGLALNTWQKNLGVPVTSVWDAATETATKALYEWMSGGEFSWSMDTGGKIVSSTGALTEDFATFPGQTTPPTPPGGNIDDDQPAQPGGGDTAGDGEGGEAEDPVARENALALFAGILDDFGMYTSEMDDLLNRAVNGDWDRNRFMRELEDTETFKQRFPSIASGATNMSPAQYIQFEVSAMQTLAYYGVLDFYSETNGGGYSVPTGGGASKPGGGSGGGSSGPGRDIGDRYIGPNLYPDSTPTASGVTSGNRPRPGDRFTGTQSGGTFTGGGLTGGARPGSRGGTPPPGGTYTSGNVAGGSGSPNAPGAGGAGPDTWMGGTEGANSWVGSDAQELIEMMIENRINIQNLDARLRSGWERLYRLGDTEFGSTVRGLFSQFYGASGDAALVAYMLDPDRVVADIERETQAAFIAGYGAQLDFNIDLDRAEQLSVMGVSDAQAWANFRQLDEISAIFSETLGEPEDFVAEGVGIDAVFGTAAGAARKLDLRRRARMAAFSGGGGALVGVSEGAIGFGSRN